MADYVQKLRDDLVEQFKGKPVIDALMEAVGDELNEVRQFYDSSVPPFSCAYALP